MAASHALTREQFTMHPRGTVIGELSVDLADLSE
jgi:hypothetical protein